MTQPRRYAGHTASAGSAAGLIYQADPPAAAPAASPSQVQAAFAAVAADRRALAGRLHAAGRAGEAAIVEIAALIAADQVLVGAAVEAVRAGTPAADAVRDAAAAQADVIAALASPELAARAADVRQVADAVLARLAGGRPERPDGPLILVRRDVAAADLIELADDGLAGAASVAGGASSHAAIIARGLGIPLVTGVSAALLGEPTGSRALIGAGGAEVVVGPAEADWLTAATPPHSGAHTTAGRDCPASGPPRTADGADLAILCNVASAAETRRGLAAGAAGVGLLRTEIPFTGWHRWPAESEHLSTLAPILGQLTGRVATVRLLDFSGDKIPPFLRGGGAGGPAGLAALLADPGALAGQLRAVLAAGRDADLAILIPMVSSPAEIERVRELLAGAARAAGIAPPRLGIMVELAATAARAELFAPAADFLSIGTNDLTGQVLGLDRLSLAARPGLAADPRVLALIEHVAAAAAAAGTAVSVCGDAAADPSVLPLLIGLGIRAVSVPAAYVQRVRGWAAELDSQACAALAAKAVRASSADEVQEMVRHARGSSA